MKLSKELIALVVAYVLLVGVVAWNSYDTRRTLDRIEIQNCISTELILLSEAGVLKVFGEQEGVDEVLRDRLLEALEEFNEVVLEACSDIQPIDIDG